MALLWTRRFADSQSNFDLRLRSPDTLDGTRMDALLDSIVKESHRGLSLNKRADKELRRFFRNPSTPLKASAYVLLSNWFLTSSGDRSSTVATRCEALWDELFPCRPLNRLSSPVAGKNHIALVAEFQSFWTRLRKAQGDSDDESSPAEEARFERTDSAGDPGIYRSTAVRPTERSEDEKSSMEGFDRLRLTFVKDGVHYKVEGSPRAIADFIEHRMNKPSKN